MGVIRLCLNQENIVYWHHLEMAGSVMKVKGFVSSSLKIQKDVILFGIILSITNLICISN